jgi:hypothetical protein
MVLNHFVENIWVAWAILIARVFSCFVGALLAEPSLHEQ